MMSIIGHNVLVRTDLIGFSFIPWTCQRVCLDPPLSDSTPHRLSQPLFRQAPPPTGSSSTPSTIKIQQINNSTCDSMERLLWWEFWFRVPAAQDTYEDEDGDEGEQDEDADQDE